MKIAGEATLVAPVDKVWDALLDPQVLVATIPGCERLEEVGEHSYAMTVTAGVAAVRGTYDGTCRLHDLVERESLVLEVEGSGAPGTIGAKVDVTFDENPDGTTTLHYDADATIGGRIGGVGQRMLSSVSRRLATEFFTNVEGTLTGTAPAATATTTAATTETAATEPTAAPSSGAVYTAPQRGDRGPGVSADFWAGLASGAGLVLVGVAAGALAGRRRR